MEFHVTIDFPDDLWSAKQAWDEQKLRKLVRFHADHGLPPIHWIDCGGIKDEAFNKGGYLDRLETAWDFIQGYLTRWRS